MEPNINLTFFISWNCSTYVCERLVKSRNLPSVNRAKFTFSEGLSSLRAQLRGLQTVAGTLLLLKAQRADKWSSGLGGFIGICRHSTDVCGWFPVEIRFDEATPALRTSSLLQVYSTCQ
jgi:hypothetical protein